MLRPLPLLLLPCLLAGCAGVWPHTAPPPANAKAETASDEAAPATRASEAELRLRLQRFADEFTQTLSEVVDEVIRSDAPL